MNNRIWKLYFGNTILIGHFKELLEFVNKHNITDFKLNTAKGKQNGKI